MADDHFMERAVKHPGALRAKAKAKGLVRGDQNLSQSDLNKLAASGDATTQRQVNLAETFNRLRPK